MRGPGTGVILTNDPEVSRRMWLIGEYMPEVAELDRRTFLPPGPLAHWLSGRSRLTVLPYL